MMSCNFTYIVPRRVTGPFSSLASVGYLSHPVSDVKTNNISEAVAGSLLASRTWKHESQESVVPVMVLSGLHRPSPGPQ